MRDPFLVSIPANLNLTAVLHADGQSRWEQYATWTVAQLVQYQAFCPARDPDAFAPLAVSHLTKVVPKNLCAPLLDLLVKAGVLERSGRPARFVPACPQLNECRTYRLAAAYRNRPLRQVEIYSLEILKKPAQPDTGPEPRLPCEVHQRLEDWVFTVTVTDDAPVGEHAGLAAIRHDQHRFTVCDQGRVHHWVANLPRELRRHVRVAGGHMVGVDVRCCQPLLLALVLSGRAAGGGARIRPENAWAAKEARRRAAERRIREVLAAGDRPGGVDDFLTDCAAGVMYDRVQEVVNHSYSTRCGLWAERDYVKEKFLAVVYGDPADADTQVGRALRQLYPGVVELAAELYPVLGHGGLARYLQTVESDLLLLGAADRFLTAHPDYPLLTVHDCLLTRPEHAHLAEEAIRQAWRDEFGLVPAVETKPFTGEDAVARPGPVAAEVLGPADLTVSAEGPGTIRSAAGGGEAANGGTSAVTELAATRRDWQRSTAAGEPVTAV